MIAISCFYERKKLVRVKIYQRSVTVSILQFFKGRHESKQQVDWQENEKQVKKRQIDSLLFTLIRFPALLKYCHPGGK